MAECSFVWKHSLVCESYRTLPPKARFSTIGPQWIKRLEVTETCALWIASVLQSGSHLIKPAQTRREWGQEEVKSRRWRERERESHHRENRRGEERWVRWSREGIKMGRWDEGEKTPCQNRQRDSGRDKQVNKAEQDGDRDVEKANTD